MFSINLPVGDGLARTKPTFPLLDSNGEVIYEPLTTDPVVIRKVRTEEYLYTPFLISSNKCIEVFVTRKHLASLFPNATVVDHETMRKISFEAHLQEDVYAFDLNYYCHVGELLWIGQRHDLFWSGIVIYRENAWKQEYPNVPFRKEYVIDHMNRLRDCFIDPGDCITTGYRYELEVEGVCIESFRDAHFVKNAYPNHEIASHHRSSYFFNAPKALNDFEVIRASELKAVYYNDSMKRSALIYPIGITIEVCVLSEESILDIQTFTYIGDTEEESHLKGVELATEWLKANYPDISRNDETKLYPYWYKETSLPFDDDYRF